MNTVRSGARIKNEIRKLSRTNKNEYQGPLGNVVQKGRYFFASKEGILIGSYKTFDQAIKSLLIEKGGKS